VTILVATGLLREVRIIGRPGVVAIAGGGNAVRLEQALEEVIALGGPTVRALLSSGVAGALDPALRPGDLVIGCEGEPLLIAALRRALPGAVSGGITGSDRAAATVEQKQALRSRSGAVAVDMESHVAARVAARHGLPFAAVRAISDGATDVLPPAALAGMRPDGAMAIGAVLRSLARDPRQIAALMRTARDAERGFRALFRCHRGLGLVDIVEHVLDMP
jgi:hopanoid-associated phosphorylase